MFFLAYEIKINSHKYDNSVLFSNVEDNTKIIL